MLNNGKCELQMIVVSLLIMSEDYEVSPAEVYMEEVLLLY